MREAVNHPDHYNTNKPTIIVGDENGVTQQISIECIDVIRAMPFWKGNAIKYLWRAGLKTEEGKSDVEKEIEDLKKAIWYIKDRIAYLTVAHELEL
jgi:hypothetical protein